MQLQAFQFGGLCDIFLFLWFRRSRTFVVELAELPHSFQYFASWLFHRKGFQASGSWISWGIPISECATALQYHLKPALSSRGTLVVSKNKLVPSFLSSIDGLLKSELYAQRASDVTAPSHDSSLVLVQGFRASISVPGLRDVPLIAREIYTSFS